MASEFVGDFKGFSELLLERVIQYAIDSILGIAFTSKTPHRFGPA